jgi:undecaprenyl-phosphate 4-deoxy-4-formamido-L-arabinose transferase
VTSISVVIPVYNSAAVLDDLLAQLAPVLAAVSDRHEVILVNDGSRDASWEAVGRLAGRYPFVRGLNLMRNYGQHNALLAGIRAARHEIVLTMDDDLQHPPGEIPTLLGALAGDVDVVYGTPAAAQHGLLRRAASTLTKLALQSVMGAETARKVSAFRAFRAGLRPAFDHYRGPYVSIDVLLTWATHRFAAVSVRHEARRVGETNYTFRKLVTHAFNMITGFSTWPLQAASLMGFCFTLFGAAVLAYVLISYLVRGGSVPGFPFLASIIAVFSGVQLFTLGIIGEYLARMHFRMMDRPTYAIRESIGPSGPPPAP